MTYQLLYRSTAVHPFPHPSDIEILRASVEANRSAGITGYLVRTRTGFFQVIEGTETAVKALLSHIADDPRHHSVDVLLEHEIPAPTYGDWAMGYAEDDGAAVFRDILEAAQGDAEFNPDVLMVAIEALSGQRGELSGRGEDLTA